MKICKILWSTNRLEFLLPTLETSQKFIDWGDHEVDGIFIDDMPTDRDDEFIKTLAENYGYNYVNLHKENMGLTNTWEESYDIISSLNKDYDFIWHQEDDLIISRHVKINDLIQYMNENHTCIQVALAYQMNWYFPQEANEVSVNKIPMKKWNDFYTFSSNHYKKGTFDTSFSLTKAKPLFTALKMWKNNQLPMLKHYRMIELENKIYCEGAIFHVMLAYETLRRESNIPLDDWCISFYDKNKENFINHIGEWSWGQRLPKDIVDSHSIDHQRKLKEGEEPPHAHTYKLERWKLMSDNPNEKINSRTWDKLS